MGTKRLNQSLRGNRCYVSLACSLGSISLACGSLLQIPNTTDRISLQRGMFLTSLGFIYFVSLTDFCNKYLLETPHGIRVRKKYRLMISDVLEITNKIVSGIQAAFSFLVGFIVCKSTCSKSFVYASHCLMEAYGWFGTAYFMYDIWAMYEVHTQKIADKLRLRSFKEKSAGRALSNGSTTNGSGMYDKHPANGNGAADVHSRCHEDEMYDFDGEYAGAPNTERWGFLKYMLSQPVMMIHHIFVGTFGFLVVTYIRGGGHCIYSYMFMMEFSTPFVSLRGMLSIMGLKESIFYTVNGLLMLGTFLVFRVLMWPYVMWRYSVAINSTFWEALTGLPIGCIIGILILFLPQIYWFYLMVRGAIKVFFPSKKRAKHLEPIEKPLLQSKNNNLSPAEGEGDSGLEQLAETPKDNH